MDKDYFKELVEEALLNENDFRSVCLTTNPKETVNELKNILPEYVKEKSIFYLGKNFNNSLEQFKKFKDENPCENCIAVIEDLQFLSKEDDIALELFEDEIIKEENNYVYILFITNLETFEKISLDTDIHGTQRLTDKTINFIKDQIPELSNKDKSFNTIFPLYRLAFMDNILQSFKTPQGEILSQYRYRGASVNYTEVKKERK